MELKFILEAILFHAQKPMNAGELKSLLAAAAANTEEPEVRTFKKTSVDDIGKALEGLEKEHAAAQRSYRLACVAGAWQFVSEPQYAPWIRTLVGEKARPPRLSQPALETLAITAYRQPLTRAEMEQIRGVSVDGVLQTLLDRGLVEAVGRADAPGRPMNYGTTVAFLEYFGLRALDELPAADELRRIVVNKPESLQTANGLATTPPEALAEGAAGPAGSAAAAEGTPTARAEPGPTTQATDAEAAPSGAEPPPII
jgi:segregation and condensation protein B